MTGAPPPQPSPAPPQAPPPVPPGRPPVMPALATAALLTGLAGFCLPVFPVAAALALLALWRYRRDPPRSGRLFAVIALAVCVADALLWGQVLWPQLKFVPARLAQRECVQTLNAVIEVEQAALTRTGRLDPDPTHLGWRPPAGARYRYWVADGEGAPALAGGVRPGLSGTCPDCAFTAACAGQLDQDPALDVWSVSTRVRARPAGELPAGQPFNDSNDVVR